MMNQEKKVSWQIGEASAPLPPLAESQNTSEVTADLYIHLYREFGPVFRLPRGEQTVTVLMGPEANVLVARHGHELLASGEFWEDFGKAMGGEQGIDLSTQRDGEMNRLRRAKSSSHYSRAKVLDQIPYMVEIAREYAQTWPLGERIALLPAMQRIVAEQLGQLLVHHEVGDYLPDFVTFLDTSIANALYTKNFQAFSEPAFLQARDRTNELARLILARRRAEPAADRKPDLLDHVLADAAEHPEAYSEQQLEQASVGPFFAGIDTVAYTSCSMLYNLNKNPQVQRRVQEEIDEVWAQGPLNWERLKGMQAIHGAALETLRMSNAQGAGSQKFRVVKPFTFGGYSLKEGDRVEVAANITHALPELFPQPDRFDIDRYHAPRNEHRHPGAFSPFGLGDHLCLGAGIAEIQLMANMATILYDYRIEVESQGGQQEPIVFSALSPGIKRLHMQVATRQH